MPDRPAIIPAILGDTAYNVEQQFNHVREISRIISYDVADGVFVSPATPDPAAFPQPSPERKIWWHLMVGAPLAYLDACLRYPTDAIFVHAEAVQADEALRTLRAVPVLAGLVINPSTPADGVSDALLDQADIVQIMTVEPGGQGRPFLPAMLGKIDALRERRPAVRFAVDGGINRDTIKQVLPHRPDYLLVGSALTKAANPPEAYRALEAAFA